MGAGKKTFPVERKYEILGILILALTTLLFLALVTDGYQGDSHRSITKLSQSSNALQAPGAFVAGVFYILIGQAAHVVYVLTAVWGTMLLRHVPIDRIWTRLLGSLLLIGSIAGILHINFAEQNLYAGGAIGAFVANLIRPGFGIIGAHIIAITTAAIGLLLATDFLFVRMIHGCVTAFLIVLRSIDELRRETVATWEARASRKVSQNRKKASTTNGLGEDQPEFRRRTFWEWITGKRDLRRIVDSVREARAARESEDLSRINVRTPAPPVEQELPFEETASANHQDDGDVAPGEYGEEQEYDWDAAGVSAPAVPDTARARMEENRPILRRKSADDELPEDHEYPTYYAKPPLSIFHEPPRNDRPDLTEKLRKTGARLEETFETFKIEARVTDITRGPTITRFELEPPQGVKVSRFLGLADNIALALKAHRVRVEAPIPGKGRVGIELPNDEADPVVIRELLQSCAFQQDDRPLTLALGKDIAGDVITADLATMPHLLVAGATGAGKTVCVKTVLASLLVSRSPDELQLVLIDPKMVELSIFDDIPHLITPVVTDPRKASTTLQWLINEMEERYRLFAHLRVRNIEVYNQSVEDGEIEIENHEDEDTESVSITRKLPYIVCIIDELADLMMLARAEVEDAIARLAQLARAVGIHLIIATQRPSVDVLTGVIKANFPARISFQVSSRVDSRCILDEIGAEKLIGRGDMLYLPPGHSKPVRIQGGFVSDAEMNELIYYLKTQAPPQYRDEIENFGKQKETKEDLLDEDDELFEDAVRVVRETGQASISMVQRRLRVGYTRAARLIDMMELRGIVGPHVGSKAREILVPVAGNGDEAA